MDAKACEGEGSYPRSTSSNFVGAFSNWRPRPARAGLALAHQRGQNFQKPPKASKISKICGTLKRNSEVWNIMLSVLIGMSCNCSRHSLTDWSMGAQGWDATPASTNRTSGTINISNGSQEHGKTWFQYPDIISGVMPKITCRSRKMVKVVLETLETLEKSLETLGILLEIPSWSPWKPQANLEAPSPPWAQAGRLGDSLFVHRGKSVHASKRRNRKRMKKETTKIRRKTEKCGKN